MSVTGSITIWLSEVDWAQQEYHDRRALAVLERVPDEAMVTVEIGDREYVSQEAAVWIHEHLGRLHVRINGSSPDAVQRFVTAAREGEWSVVS